MEIFQQQHRLLEGGESKKIIKNYNKLAKVLLEFEVLYHRGWLRQVGLFVVFNPLRTGNPIMGSMANSEDPGGMTHYATDEMPHNAAFHQGLHCLLRQN